MTIHPTDELLRTGDRIPQVPTLLRTVTEEVADTAAVADLHATPMTAADEVPRPRITVARLRVATDGNV